MIAGMTSTRGKDGNCQVVHSAGSNKGVCDKEENRIYQSKSNTASLGTKTDTFGTATAKSDSGRFTVCAPVFCKDDGKPFCVVADAHATDHCKQVQDAKFKNAKCKLEADTNVAINKALKTTCDDSNVKAYVCGDCMSLKSRFKCAEYLTAGGALKNGSGATSTR
jgi:hypothetical protein